MPRRRYRISYLYITQEFIFSFLVAFLFFFGIFFVNQLLLLAEDILTRNVPLGAVLRLILYSLPSIVALSFPFGALVGSLMAVGRLVGNNEIQAFQASGVPTGRIFAPIAALGLVLSLGSFVMNDYLLPLGTLNFGRLYRELLYANPELELEPYSIRRYQDSTIITGMYATIELTTCSLSNAAGTVNALFLLALLPYLETKLAGVLFRLTYPRCSHIPEEMQAATSICRLNTCSTIFSYEILP